MEDLKIVIGKNIQFLRKKQNLTQQDLADKLNYTAKAISKWERGDSIPELETLILIAKEFNVTLDYLVNENIDKSKADFLPSEIKDKNQIFMIALAVTIVWTISCIVFAYIMQVNHDAKYELFVWSVPSSFLVIPLGIRKKEKKIRVIFLSLLLWTILIAFFYQFISYNLLLIFLIGIPAQLALFLWSKIIVIK